LSPTLEVGQEVQAQAGRDETPPGTLVPDPFLSPEVEETPPRALSEGRPTLDSFLSPEVEETSSRPHGEERLPSEKSPATGASPAPSEASEELADGFAYQVTAEDQEAPGSTPSSDDEVPEEVECDVCDPLQALGRASEGYRAVQNALRPVVATQAKIHADISAAWEASETIKQSGHNQKPSSLLCSKYGCTDPSCTKSHRGRRFRDPEAEVPDIPEDREPSVHFSVDARVRARSAEPILRQRVVHAESDIVRVVNTPSTDRREDGMRLGATAVASLLYL